jgi:NADH dehydrogenase/NADH:ubiquinone oxidoreductase subunit G
MPKGKNDDTVELDFDSTDTRELKGSDANPVDAATGESLFDDLSPRFVRKLDAAVERVNGRPAKESKAEDDDLDSDEDESEDLDESDEDEDLDEDEPRVDTEEQDSEEDDEDADEPRQGRGSKFEKRLSRADRLLEETRSQLTEMQQRERDREAKDKLASDTAEFNTFKADTETKLADLKAQKVKAIEDGDTAAHVDIDEQIIELKSELRSRTREHETAKKNIEQASQRRGASQITLTKVAQWKRKNPRYAKDPEFAAAVNGIDSALVSSGSNPESDEHYKEIDRRLAKLFPASRKTPPPRRHPSSQQVREEAPRRQAGDAKVTVKGGKIKISPAKLARVKANMRTFGLDPTNPTDLKDYILNNPGL